jgi:hypothetical protein
MGATRRSRQPARRHLDRVIYAVARYRIVHNKKTLASLATALLVAGAWKAKPLLAILSLLGLAGSWPYKRFTGSLLFPAADVPLPMIGGQQSYGLQIFRNSTGGHVAPVQTRRAR